MAIVPQSFEGSISPSDFSGRNQRHGHLPNGKHIIDIFGESLCLTSCFIML